MSAKGSHDLMEELKKIEGLIKTEANHDGDIKDSKSIRVLIKNKMLSILKAMGTDSVKNLETEDITSDEEGLDDASTSTRKEVIMKASYSRNILYLTSETVAREKSYSIAREEEVNARKERYNNARDAREVINLANEEREVFPMKDGYRSPVEGRERDFRRRKERRSPDSYSRREDRERRENGI